MAKKFAPSSEGIEVEGKLNEIIITETIRPNGSLRIQQGFDFCPTMAEQHSANVTDLNYLIERYKPDELAAYMAARAQYRQEILGHDFSQEPDLQGAKNEVLRLRKAFEDLDPEIKQHFKNHVEFLKFIDNPANQEKMIKLGLMTLQEVKNVTTDGATPTQEKEQTKKEQQKPS